MEYITNQHFENEEISFDGAHYIGCSFKNCTIHIHKLNFDYDRCTFTDTKFKLSPKIYWLQNIYSLLPNSLRGNTVLQA
ncbi:hypothetical protein ACFO9Q_18355 [Paenibacillus sp. GCM10023252]|uniref:hypothetical protein n=1 Tax=Paenibacillus sp. GCM10023252 TaxID=3252649 RepID=UPI003617E061